jgi:thioesterase domain-containing protein
MDEFGLESYLHDHIPLTKHLGVRVARSSSEVVELFAPLEPNLNHRKTGFGGSISAVAILAGWGLLWCRLRGRAAGHNIVIQRNTIEYVAPVTADFTARCVAPSPTQWKRFERMFEQRGRSRIDLKSIVCVGEDVTAQFDGRFVVLGNYTD